MKQADYISKTKNYSTQKEENSSSVFDFLNQEIKLFATKFQDRHKESYYSELKVLLSAGVDFIDALSIIEQQFKKSKHKKYILNIKNDILNGDSLSEAMRNQNQFSEYELYSLQIGEETGKLVEICNELHDFYKKKIEQRRKIISALSYPIVVCVTAFFAIVFMLRFLVPMFSNVYKQFGGELPGITKVVLFFSTLLENYFLVILLTLLLSFFLLYSFRKKRSLQKLYDLLLFKTPIVKNISRKIYVARFCRSMSLLLGSGVPLLTALQFTEKMIGRITIQEFLLTAQDNILQGQTLHKSLSSFYLFPNRFLSMIKVGEKSNQLPSLFDQLSEQYTNEVEHQTGLINSLLEPIIILVLGFVVGFILIALYLPIFELSTNFGV